MRRDGTRCIALAGAVAGAALWLSACAGDDCEETAESLLGPLESLACDTTERGDPDEAPYALTVRLSQLDAWEGRKLVVLVDEPGTMDLRREIRIEMNEHSPRFENVLHPGLTYVVHAWIDADGDDGCDAPPEDAAWRVEVADPRSPLMVRLAPSVAMTPTCP
jgi:hypothetical protein